MRPPAARTRADTAAPQAGGGSKMPELVNGRVDEEGRRREAALGQACAIARVGVVPGLQRSARPAEASSRLKPARRGSDRDHVRLARLPDAGRERGHGVGDAVIGVLA